MTLSPAGSILGNGLIGPFHRLTGTDFVSGSGEALVRACIRQILMTDPGELRWRPEFGAGLSRKRHRNNNLALKGEVEAAVRTGIAVFEPRADVKAVNVEAVDEQLKVSVSWAIVQPGSSSGRVLAGPFQTSVLI
jgi:Bacteriophage baseplate protein W